MKDTCVNPACETAISENKLFCRVCFYSRLNAAHQDKVRLACNALKENNRGDK